jgi:hypothetical protein
MSLPNPDPDLLRVVVHLGASLRHELTPRRFLQECVVSQKDADVEWKLPESSRPVIDMCVPEQTALDLQLGKTNLLVKGVRGDAFSPCKMLQERYNPSNRRRKRRIRYLAGTVVFDSARVAMMAGTLGKFERSEGKS